jgi:cytoskeletal protein CcmA (bactofilin family)
VSVNDFIHVIEDETHDYNTTQYVITAINTDTGMITYTFDLVISSHTESTVNGKSDISGLQTAISNAKFTGELNGNLNVSGDSTTGSLVVSEDTVIKGSAVVGTIIDKDALFSVYGDVNATGDLSAKNMTLGNDMLVKGDSTFSHNARVNGNLTVDRYIYGHTATFDADTSYQGNLTVGSSTNNNKKVYMYSSTTFDNNLTINKNLTVLGTLNANLNLSYTYTAPSASTSPNWCRIMTINMTSNRFTPLKFSILGSRPASGWPPYFDEDYYIQFRRVSNPTDLSDT